LLLLATARVASKSTRGTLGKAELINCTAVPGKI